MTLSRREIIETLLDHLLDFETTLINTGEGSGGNTPMMPSMWHHPSVRELYHTIDRLRDRDHTAWAHLIAYYHAETRIATTRQRVRNRRGALIHPPRWEPGPPQSERILNGWILEPPRRRGLDWIITNYRGQPFLPDELRSELVA